MVNNSYNKNILEAVTQGSNRLVVLLRDTLCKTTLFLLLANNTFAQDFFDEFKAGIDQFNQNNVVHIDYSNEKIENAEEAEARCEREKTEIRDVQLNKAEIREGRYWVDGRWVCPSKTYEPAKSEKELKDSDGDGYDDYTEFKNGTSPNDARLFPAVREGNNKVIFK
jgi:hypothetical protein